MVTSDILFHLIADLQHDVTVTHGRRTLLQYAQTSSGARQALLFVLDEKHQTLVLLGRYGPRPRLASSSLHHLDPDNPRRIPAHGLFGSALHRRGLLYIPHADSDQRSLPEERYWIGANGHVILSAVGTQQAQQGVLVVCFDPKNTEGIDSILQPHDLQARTDEGNLLVCTTLLSAYLSPKDKKVRFFNDGRKSQVSPGRATTRGPSPHHTSPAPTETEPYEIKLQAAIDQERSRIARDIHDGVAQHLAHGIQKLEFIQRVFDKQPEVALRELDRTSTILKESLHDLLHGISSLLPVQLEKQGFAAALHTLLDQYRRDEPALKIDYEANDLSLLPPALEAPLFRFIQEALTNVRKHAHASRVTLRLQLFTGLLVVEVSDNGQGFDVERVMGSIRTGASRHFGLRSMRDRIQQAGGSWEIQSTYGQGTTVKARFPLTTASPSVVLTNREREVLRLLAEGLTNREIAERLSVSTETVKSHVHHIMQKMQVNDRTHAAVKAAQQQWL